MKYYCCNENRRDLVRAHPGLNGIDYIEVIDNPDDPDEVRQRELHIFFLKEPEVAVTPENIKFKEGDADSPIQVLQVEPVISGPASPPDSPPASPPEPSKGIKLQLDQAGNFSIYTLCLVDAEDREKVLDGMDKLLSCIEFSFKVACDTNSDCKEQKPACEPEDRKDIPINYLAKDYASFKQLMLDRMSLIMPQWQERNAADLGIALVEQLAYAADHLSYRQDAISTEAYLRTARKRASVRRHARLVDYQMHEGVNARAWIRIEIGDDSDGQVLKKHFLAEDPANQLRDLLITSFMTGAGDSTVMKHDNKKFSEAVRTGSLVYELMYDLPLFAAHNEMQFHTYGEAACCLPKGATEAALRGQFPNLNEGDVLMLVEKLGPETGNAADADPGHRHVVRITEITEEEDVNFVTPGSPPDSPPVPFIPVTRIRWSQEDALPFPLCISGKAPDGPGVIENISVVYGNIALVDHGMTYTDEPGSAALFENLQGSVHPVEVPHPVKEYAGSSHAMCGENESQPVRPRYTPSVDASPLTHSQTDTLKAESLAIAGLDNTLSAAALVKQEVRSAKPQILLFEIEKNESGSGDDWTTAGRWEAKRDLLLDSQDNSQHFVAEVDEAGECRIRFGDDINGKLPNAGVRFLARFRTGNGSTGNAGAGAIRHLVTQQDISIVSISNPLPASGGEDPETLEEVKQYAPEAFRTQERAVTREDYEFFAKRCRPDVQRATAAYRWTGSWHTAFVSADRYGNKPVDEEFERGLRECLEKYRMAGMDLEVDAPIQIGLQVDMEVCIGPDYFQSEIRSALMRLFSNRPLSGGKKGIFHPDNFSFGESVYLSTLYATAQSVEGVTSVKITGFSRLGNTEVSGLKDGVLTFNRKEIPRLDNDPNFRDRGVFNLTMKGGR